METKLIIRIDEQLKKSFDNAASSNDRNASQLIRDFIKQYIQQNKQADIFEPRRKTK